MGVLRRFKSMKGMFSKSNTQQNIPALSLATIADDDGFEEYDPAAFEVKSPAPEAFSEESSDDQFVPGAWRIPRPSERLAKSSGHSVPSQGQAVVSRSGKRPESGQWEAYDPAAFETKPAEIPEHNKTPNVRLPSPKPSKAIHNIPSRKVSSHGGNTKLVKAESAEAAGRARSSPRNDFAAYAERTLSIDDSSSSADPSPRRLAGPTPPALQNTSRASPRRKASPKTKNLDTAELPAKSVQPIRGTRQSNWPLGDPSTQLAVGQSGSGGWAAFDAAYKAKFGEAIPPSGTAAVARKLGSPQILAVQGPNGRSSDPTVEALTATLTLHSSGNTTLTHRLASPQPPMVPTLGNKSQHLPLEADQPLKEWPFRDLRVGETSTGDKVDSNFRLPKAEPAPGALKEWPFKGFKVADITDRDRSGFGRKQSASGAVLSPHSSPPPTVDQSTIYAESTIDGSQEEDKDCMICAYTLPKLAFPSPTIAPSCTHEVSTCLSCLAKSIRHDLENRMWDKIQCPECRALLDHYSVRKYADEETFARYESLSLRAVMANSPDFAWCRGPGCLGGQIHAGGAEQPIMTCVLCNFRTCFFHQVAWHNRLTCEEYDAMQQDPDGFQSAIEKEEAALAAQEAARVAQEQQDMELARNLEAQDLAAQEEARLTRERQNAELVRRRAEEKAAKELQEREDEEMARALERDSEIARVRELEEKAAERRRQAEEEQRRREAAEAEQKRKEAEKRRLAQEAEAKRLKEAEAKRQRIAAEAEAKRKLEEAKKNAEVKRKREEEAASLKMVNRTTKKCPGYNCSRPIEKNDGCAHMTCIKCRHEFCWDCLKDYKEIRKTGNDKHAPTCPFHTNNIRD